MNGFLGFAQKEKNGFLGNGSRLLRMLTKHIKTRRKHCLTGSEKQDYGKTSLKKSNLNGSKGNAIRLQIT